MKDRSSTLYMNLTAPRSAPMRSQKISNTVPSISDLRVLNHTCGSRGQAAACQESTPRPLLGSSQPRRWRQAGGKLQHWLGCAPVSVEETFHVHTDCMASHRLAKLILDAQLQLLLHLRLLHARNLHVRFPAVSVAAAALSGLRKSGQSTVRNVQCAGATMRQYASPLCRHPLSVVLLMQATRGGRFGVYLASLGAGRWPAVASFAVAGVSALVAASEPEDCLLAGNEPDDRRVAGSGPEDRRVAGSEPDACLVVALLRDARRGAPASAAGCAAIAAAAAAGCAAAPGADCRPLFSARLARVATGEQTSCLCCCSCCGAGSGPSSGAARFLPLQHIALPMNFVQSSAAN